MITDMVRIATSFAGSGSNWQFLPCAKLGEAERTIRAAVSRQKRWIRRATDEKKKRARAFLKKVQMPIEFDPKDARMSP